MQCSKCKKFMKKDDLIKVTGNYMNGISEPIEYYAKCPYCKSDMGKMSWGKFIPCSELAKAPNVAILYVCPQCNNDITKFLKELKGKQVIKNGDVKCPRCQAVISKLVWSKYAHSYL